MAGVSTQMQLLLVSVGDNEQDWKLYGVQIAFAHLTQLHSQYSCIARLAQIKLYSAAHVKPLRPRSGLKRYTGEQAHDRMQHQGHVWCR